jgi:stage II sporulation protein D
VTLLLLLPMAVWWAYRRDPARPLETAAVKSPAASKLRSIRVSLTPEPVSKIIVSVEGPYRIESVTDRRKLVSGKRLSPITVKPEGTGLQLQSREFEATQIDLIPENDGSVWMGDHAYRGIVRVQRTSSGRLLVINRLPLETYLASVVDSEMPTAFGREARVAQAIAARTFAIFRMQAADAKDSFDLYASTRSQKYLGCRYRNADGRLLAGETSESRSIVEETAGQVCTDQGRVFCPYYSAACGGRTLTGTELFPDAAACVRGVGCPYCATAPSFHWTARIPLSTAAEKLRRPLSRDATRFGTPRTVRSVRLDETGQLPMFEFSDGKTSGRISAQKLRELFGLSEVRSLNFTLEVTDGELVFTGKGHGHGVGLCQWGARGLAKQGRTGPQILAYYYPGCRITSWETLTSRSREATAR